jgi:hypothetical protein
MYSCVVLIVMFVVAIVFLSAIQTTSDPTDCHRTQLQCLTKAKAHSVLPPNPPFNLDRMDKNVPNLNIKFKLFRKNYSTSFSFKDLI